MALDVSQRDLARKMDAHVVTVAKIEADRTVPRERTISALAAALGVSREALTDDQACMAIIAQSLDVQLPATDAEAKAVAKIVEGLRTLLSR